MKIEGRYLPMPEDLLCSDAFKVAPPGAMKILLAIGNNWVERGCRDNGNLVVTYKTIRLATGIKDKHAIALGLKQLEALGLLITNHGKSMGAEREPNRYRLPWLPGHNGGPPGKEYLDIQSEDHGKRLLEGLKKKRRNYKERKLRVIVEFEGV
jgi:hypothetical protein